MEVNVKAIHFEATGKLIEFINKKADRLQRHFPAISDIEVKLTVIKPESAMNKEVVITAFQPQDEVVGNKVADTFEEAVDLALEAMERQLEKRKDKK